MAIVKKISLREIKKRLNVMTALMLRMAGELYAINPEAVPFKDGTFDDNNRVRLALIANKIKKLRKGAHCINCKFRIGDYDSDKLSCKNEHSEKFGLDVDLEDTCPKFVSDYKKINGIVANTLK